MSGIIISRTDRAGDLILTLPLFEAVRIKFPEAALFAHVRSYTAPLLRGYEDDITIIQDVESGNIFHRIKKLSQSFSQINADAAIIVHPSLIALSAAFLAKIPVRIGRASNVWQFFLNRPVYQGRSKNEKHEYEYNLDLINGFGSFSPMPKAFPRLKLTHKASIIAEKMIPFRSFVIVHPGHGGSAYNLSIRKYAEIADKLAKFGINIVVTAGPEEKKVIEAFKKLSECENIRILSSIPDLEQLAGVISRAKALICGSTGPLHIAAALNVPTVAFFPPVPEMTPVRWGPKGNSSIILLPDNAKCNRNSNCKSCLFAPCMEKIQIEKAIDWIKLSVSQ